MRFCRILVLGVLAACGPGVSNEPDAGLDTDGDGILDIHEGTGDYDEDGTPNAEDLDSDSDCIPDADEARGSPPADTDADGRFDFIDHDSDNDGIADADEDTNCNGVQDGSETSATADDSDHDGATDLVENVAGTDPLDPTDNPQAHGDFVFLEPYQDPPRPAQDDLDFTTDLIMVDVYLLIDRTGSMTTELADVKANLAAAMDGVRCPPLGTGTPGDCIPDLWFGAGLFTYEFDEPYIHHADIGPAPSLTTMPDVVMPPTTNTKDTGAFAAWAAITGEGSDTCGCTIAAVQPRASCDGSPAQLAGHATFGYPCFRAGALPVVLFTTDEAPYDPNWDNYPQPPWPTTAAAFNARSAKIIGIKGSNPFGTLDADLTMMTTDTSGAALLLNGADTGADEAIAAGVHDLASTIPIDVSVMAHDVPDDTVDAVAAFIDHFQTLQLGNTLCASGLDDVDTDGDQHPDAFVDVPVRTPVCWTVVPRSNTTVLPTSTPQLFRATVDVYAEGVTQVDSRDVYFLVPPLPLDIPVE